MRLSALTFLLVFPGWIAAQDYYLIAGTYDSPASEGIYVYRFSSADGSARAVSHIRATNASFVTLSADGRFVYAVSETAPPGGNGGEITAYSFDKQTSGLQLINTQRSGGDHPCHVEPDRTGKWLFVSNYSSGTLSVLPINADGSIGPARSLQHSGSGRNPLRQQGPHVHWSLVTPGNNQLLVADLGIDKMMIYDFDPATGKLLPAGRPYALTVHGAGPRAIALHPNNKYVYLLEELSGTVVFYKYRNGKVYGKQRISTLAAGDTLPPNSAHIQVSPDGKFLYASNRGEVNNIAIYEVRANGKLRLKEHQPALGRSPRYFSIDPTGKYLLCGNQLSDEIVVFKRNPESGQLTDTGNRIKMGRPVCLKWTTPD